MAEIFGEIFGDREVVEGDLANPAVIQSNVKRQSSTIDTVIHCAGETTFWWVSENQPELLIDELLSLKCSAWGACWVSSPRRLFAGPKA